MILGSLQLSTEFSLISFDKTERGDARLVLCNTLNLDNSFTLILSNAKLGVVSTIYFNFPILAFDTFVVPFSISLSQGDSISAKASNSGLVLSLLK